MKVLFFLFVINIALGQSQDSDCLDDFQLVGNEFKNNYNYNATTSITTASNYRVASANGELWLKAGSAITLEANTHIDRNSKFLARIEPCIICNLAFSYPNFFTPNGDMTNDVWRVNWTMPKDFSQVIIFDRFGKIVKILNHPNDYWDGLYNKQPLFSNDYWFKLLYIDCNGISKEYKSHFALKR